MALPIDMGDILAISISIISLIFVIIVQTPQFFFGFREHSSTLQRTKEIEEKINIELNEELDRFRNFLKENTPKDESLTVDIKEAYEEIGNTVYILNNITKTLLKNTTRYSQRAFGYFIATIFSGSMMLYIYSSEDISIILYAYIGVILYVSYLCIRELIKYNRTRELFAELHEEPTLIKSFEIWNEIEEKTYKKYEY